MIRGAARSTTRGWIPPADGVPDIVVDIHVSTLGSSGDYLPPIRVPSPCKQNAYAPVPGVTYDHVDRGSTHVPESGGRCAGLPFRKATSVSVLFHRIEGQCEISESVNPGVTVRAIANFH